MRSCSIANNAAPARVDTPNLVVDMAHVVVDGDVRDNQSAADLLVRPAPRYQPQHRHLTIAQTGRPAGSRPAADVARGGQHGVGSVRIETPRADVGFDQAGGL
jgi:hypothetical protein